MVVKLKGKALTEIIINIVIHKIHMQSNKNGLLKIYSDIVMEMKCVFLCTIIYLSCRQQAVIIN